MTSSVRNPELLRHSRRTVDGEGLVLNTVSRGSLHFRSVVAVSELSEAEATHDIQGVASFHEGQVSISTQGSERSTEEVELDGKFSGQGGVNKTQHFVSSENVFRVIIKVKDGDNALIGDSLNAGIGQVSFFI